MSMIKVLCCEHFIKDLIDQGTFFKFSRDFNCDCVSHEKVVVLECKDMLEKIGSKNLVKEDVCSGCEKKKPCERCKFKAFYLNYSVFNYSFYGKYNSVIIE